MSSEAPKKQKLLDRLAEESSVAIVVLNEDSQEVSVSNNNSICRTLTASPDFSPRCAEYCGKAFQNTAAGELFEYECYAGFTCKAIPVADRDGRFVAIVGRAFEAAEKYRRATDRAISGDWSHFPTNDFFENVLISGSSSNIEKAVDALSKYRVRPAEDVHELEHENEQAAVEAPEQVPQVRATEPPPDEITKPDEELHAIVESAAAIEAWPGDEQRVAEVTEAVPQVPATEPPAEEIRKHATVKFAGPTEAWPGDEHQRVAEATAQRSLYGRLAKLPYEEACALALEFLGNKLGFESLVWLERKDSRFVPVTAMGSLNETPIKIGIQADNQSITGAAQQERGLELHERMTRSEERQGRILNLFMSVVGGEVRGAIGIEGHIDDTISREISLFCRRISPQIEILRLRQEVSDRDWLNRAVARFNQSLRRIDAEDFWTHVTQVSAELVQAERASLLVRNEQSDDLLAKATVGARVNLFAEPGIGDRISKLVLEDGNPVIVEDITRIGIRAAPTAWQYKTASFLSYPITIGDRRIGVMNFTDKASGEIFGERDLELLQAIGPQIAVAIDRTVLKDKAGEFEQLSVTDALTGLLNRRYLEKRLSEEIQRSKRHRFPMSLMMLDVDEFKSYNDMFGHPAGDAALKIVANVLQDVLRGADVAARYGGEEFAVLLPQTTLTEAAAIAERLRQRIEHTEFPKRRVTVSIGIASCSNETDTPADIVAAADHALYEAKDHGRNNVRIYDSFGKRFNENIH
ncbi:MAG TPA: diguanylate cyclase [Pyrinomonadaceae bacterium]|nr:diguanylate cyclase [Pyrinomonadaceae bacterium]